MRLGIVVLPIRPITITAVVVGAFASVAGLALSAFALIFGLLLGIIVLLLGKEVHVPFRGSTRRNTLLTV